MTERDPPPTAPHPSAASAPKPERSARRVEKPWGHELIWAENELYTGKILHVRAGEALSLQYHRRKDETLHVLSGRVRLLLGPSEDRLEERVLEAGETIRIRPGTRHRMIALEDVEIVEASTTHPEDVVRIADRYGRAGYESGETS